LRVAREIGRREPITLAGRDFDLMRGRLRRSGRGQERGRRSRPVLGFSSVSVVSRCTGE
jgi:hypothetical protein